MKKFLVLALAFSLIACGPFKQVSDSFTAVVNPDNFDTVTIAYAGVSTAGNTYYDLCERKVINKACWKTIARLQPYENEAYKAYMNLDAFVRSNPSGDASTFIRIARGAIDTLKSIQLQNGVK